DGFEPLEGYRSGTGPTDPVDVLAPRPAHVRRALPPRVAVPRREGCRLAEGALRQALRARRVADDDVRAGDAVRVEPEVLGAREPERQPVVVARGAPHEDLEAVAARHDPHALDAGRLA